MLIRRDIKPNGTPVRKDLQQVLTRMGGVNPFGEPLFRLLRAEDRITQAAGAWAVWPDDVSVEDRGGLQIQQAQHMVKENQEMLQRMFRVGATIDELKKVSRENANIINEFLQARVDVAPLRVEVGMVDIEVYPYEGWIIERWKPAHLFGSPTEWEEFRFDGQSALGPYPYQGEYEMMAGPTPYMPSTEELKDAIRQHVRAEEDKPSNPAMRVLRMMERREQEREKRVKQRKSDLVALMGDSPASLRARISLGAGRVRNELAAKAGLKGHYGN
jgi:hypothetical protein